MKPSHIEVVFGRVYYVDDFGNYFDVTPGMGGGGGGGMPTTQHSSAALSTGAVFDDYRIESISHFDVSSFKSDYIHIGNFSAGSWQSDTFSITLDKVWTPYGTSVTYDMSESQGWGNWASGTGWSVFSGQNYSQALHLEHNESPWNVSTYIHTDVDSSSFWSSQNGNMFVQSSQSQHEGQTDQWWSGIFGSGETHQSVLSRLDNFHFQDGVFSSDSQHSLQLVQSETQWSDPFSNGVAHSQSYDAHDFASVSGPGYFSSHAEDVSMHSSDLTIASVNPAYIAPVDHSHDAGWLMKG